MLLLLKREGQVLGRSFLNLLRFANCVQQICPGHLHFADLAEVIGAVVSAIYTLFRDDPPSAFPPFADGQGGSAPNFMQLVENAQPIFSVPL